MGVKRHAVIENEHRSCVLVLVSSVWDLDIPDLTSPSDVIDEK